MYWILILLMGMGGYVYFRKRPPTPVRYEQLYGLGTPFLHETAENIAADRVQEETPEGAVTMWRAEDVFMYSSPRAVQYKYLETVARKYCIVFDCREAYVNIFRELLKNVPAPEEKLDDVFIQLKPYNRRPRAICKDNCNRYKWVPIEKEPVKQLSYADFKKMS